MVAQLYCFGESGNAYKAALTMTLAGFEWSPVYVDFFNGETRTPEFRAINPMGECPVLVDQGQTLTQSGMIQLHVAEATGKFTPTPEVMRWLFWDNHKGSSQFGALRFMMNFLPEDKRPQEAIGWLSGRVQAALTTLNDHLAGRDWIAGDGPSLADFACCAYLYYPEPFGYSATTFPNIAAWLDQISAIPGWKHPYDMMPGSPADRA
ncbi:glutathione S-transferase [Thioclava sp. SK-1]|uniref:glutathione S-transferase family protein n=1 Tax=Thioclava sp. SK-1 TaxID=1889770 RepID=UPI00082555BC|nr:glutathione S-transferase [Thioclava sp. SK-1]OCX66740.1 glutathione S-transferase [Thioclava sp. SK-1]